MYVYSNKRYKKVYNRKDGSKYYMSDGKRVTVRKTQKLYPSTNTCSVKKSSCFKSSHCKWVTNKGCSRSQSRRGNWKKNLQSFRKKKKSRSRSRKR